MKKIFENKSVIVTGGTDGFGLAIAKNFIDLGANLIVCSRNKERVENFKDLFTNSLDKNQKIISIKADISHEDDVKKLFSAATDNFESIDIIINNAGIYGPIGNIEDIDWERWIEAININLFGSILVIKNAIPILKKQNKGKIIQVSGGGATNPMPNFSSYAVSKTGIVRFVETISQELKNYKIDINAIAPGPLNTKMLDDLIQSGPENVGEDFYNKSIKQKESGGAGFNRGIQLINFLSSSASDGISGKLISALWDKYENWSKYKKDLINSDAYTLRRITGRERNFDWGDK
tara:strand:+ start:310 stop:1185 length:876 start_codon:yes stop_codon:yes gene_type:complete